MVKLLYPQSRTSKEHIHHLGSLSRIDTSSRYLQTPRRPLVYVLNVCHSTFLSPPHCWLKLCDFSTRSTCRKNWCLKTWCWFRILCLQRQRSVLKLSFFWKLFLFRLEYPNVLIKSISRSRSIQHSPYTRLFSILLSKVCISHCTLISYQFTNQDDTSVQTHSGT